MIKLRWKTNENGDLETDKQGQNKLQFFILKNLIMLGKVHENNFAVKVNYLKKKA